MKGPTNRGLTEKYPWNQREFYQIITPKEKKKIARQDVNPGLLRK